MNAYSFRIENFLQSTSGVISKLLFDNYCDTDTLIQIVPRIEKLVLGCELSDNFMISLSDSILISAASSNLRRVAFVDCNLNERAISKIVEWMPFVKTIRIYQDLEISSVKKINDAIVSAFDSKKLCLEGLSLNCFNSENIKVFTECISLIKNLSLTCHQELCCDSLTQITNSIKSAYDSGTYYLETLSLMGGLLTDDHVRCLSPCIPYIKCVSIGLTTGLTSLSTSLISDSITAATGMINVLRRICPYHI